MKYQYRCENCGYQEEIKQSIKDEPLKVCPRCRGRFYRVIGNIGIVFKGQGFHVNDYKAGK